MSDIEYRISPALGDIILNRLFATAWPEHEDHEYGPVLERSLLYVGAFDDDTLVGFVNVAWDGGSHAFLLDPTVTPAYRHHGIGTELINRAIEAASEHGAEWLHVDYVPELEEFFARHGFAETKAGVLRLGTPSSRRDARAG
jgi:GNAT superfamily N-acetyltransferase